MSLSRPASPFGRSVSTGTTTSNPVKIFALPPEAEMLHLIKLFFSDTGMLFPYIHQEGILETFALAKQSNFRGVRRSWLCLLNMILAFAACVSARPDLPVEMKAAESDIFFQRAQALSNNVAFKSANLETGKSPVFPILSADLTLCSAISPPDDPVPARDPAISPDWNIHGLTVKAALQLGLHSDEASGKFSTLESEIRRRTWYGCIVLDR